MGPEQLWVHWMPYKTLSRACSAIYDKTREKCTTQQPHYLTVALLRFRTEGAIYTITVHFKDTVLLYCMLFEYI